MKGQGRTSLQQKLVIAFAVIICCIMAINFLLHMRTVNVIREITYEKMKAQAEYYQETFEMEVNYVLSQQLDFFNDRKLPFIASSVSILEAYEEREAVLNVQEKIGTLTNSTKLIDRGILYIPGSRYVITPGIVRRMTGQDEADMERYLQREDNGLQYDGKNFYCVRTGEANTSVAQHPLFVFVITFSSEEIREKLSILNTSEKGGALLYHESEGVLIESSQTECTGMDILGRLGRNESGEYETVQRVRIDDEDFLVLVGEQGEMGAFVQYVEEGPLMEYIDESWRYMLIFLIFLVFMSSAFILYTRNLVHKPLNTLIQAFERMKDGNLTEHIEQKADGEFAYLYRAFNDMEDKLGQLIDEVYVQKNLTQRAQLKQLQAQINPHFLYNSFFILRRRIKRQDYENAEEFAWHLGNYFKYLTRDGADYLSLQQEVEHAKSYAAIQQARFSSRLRIEFEELPKECEGILVPRLILQPLLENAFGHGLENKESGGILRVRFEEKAGKLWIIVEDNGEEAGDADIERMNCTLEEQKPDEVTGIVNIHRRLKAYFHQKAGLHIVRSPLGGIAAIIEIEHGGNEEKDELEFTDSR